MDALLMDLQNVCTQLLPILGAVALVFLCIFIKKLWQMVDTGNERLKQLSSTLDKADLSMEKIQAPLDTAVKLSHSVDKLQDKAEQAFGKMTDFTTDSLNNLKDFAARKKEENEQEGTEQVKSDE